MAVYHLDATITGDNGLFVEVHIPVELGIRDAGTGHAYRAIGLSWMQSLQTALNAELKKVSRSVWALPVVEADPTAHLEQRIDYLLNQYVKAHAVIQDLERRMKDVESRKR